MYPNDELKNLYNPDKGRYVDYAVCFEILDNDSQNNSNVVATEDTIISIKDNIFTNRNYFNIATFEHNGYPLDGSVIVPPNISDNNGNIGYLSNVLSDDKSNITDTVTITSLYIADIISTTVCFGYVYAVDFTLSYYNDDNMIIHSKVVYNNKDETFIYSFALSNVKKIIITVSKLSRTYSRLRIAYFLWGKLQIYNKNNSDSLQIIEIFDPLNERVPSCELKLTAQNNASEYDIFNPTGVYSYFKDRQILNSKIGAGTSNNNIRYISMGQYYLKKPQLSGNTSKITLSATNIFGILSNTIYSKGTYKTATIFEFVSNILSDVGIRYFICPPEFETTVITSYLPSKTHTDCLRKIAQSTNTALFVDKLGIINFNNLTLSANIHIFDGADYFSESGIEPSDGEIINTVTTESQNFSINSEDKLCEISGNGTINIKYSPSVQQRYTITTGSISNITYFVDNAIVTISGSAVIYGKKINVSKQSYTVCNKKANEQSYIYEIKDNEFINQNNVSNIADYLLKLKSIYRRNLKVLNRGYPYLDMTDNAKFNYNGTDKTQRFFVTKNVLKCGGGMSGELTCNELPIAEVGIK